jgi:hypothetical protein
VIAFVLLLGVGVYVGYRWFAPSVHELGAELRADDKLCQNSAGRLERDLGALEYDPASGVYRPVRRS